MRISRKLRPTFVLADITVEELIMIKRGLEAMKDRLVHQPNKDHYTVLIDQIREALKNE